jgi:hypothetical protein
MIAEALRKPAAPPAVPAPTTLRRVPTLVDCTCLVIAMRLVIWATRNNHG